jgi:long-subunit acyl-CoA synthetase (AMP-forming)
VPGLKLKLIGIFSKNRLEWMITDIASAFGGYTTVPLYYLLINIDMIL